MSSKIIKKNPNGLISVNNLIREVKAWPLLWDRKNDSHENRKVTDKIWTEIADTFGVTNSDVRNRWRRLRDTFRRYLKKSKRNSSNYKCTWKYYSSLMFLKDHCLDPVEKIAIVPKTETDIEDWKSESIDPLKMEQAATISPSVLTDLLRNFQEDLISVEKSKVALLNTQDDDMLYFQSLLPYIKTLEFDKKFILRTRIQQLVSEFSCENSATNNVSCNRNGQ